MNVTASETAPAPAAPVSSTMQALHGRAEEHYRGEQCGGRSLRRPHHLRRPQPGGRRHLRLHGPGDLSIPTRFGSPRRQRRPIPRPTRCWPAAPPSTPPATASVLRRTSGACPARSTATGTAPLSATSARTRPLRERRSRPRRPRLPSLRPRQHQRRYPAAAELPALVVAAVRCWSWPSPVRLPAVDNGGAGHIISAIRTAKPEGGVAMRYFTLAGFMVALAVLMGVLGGGTAPRNADAAPLAEIKKLTASDAQLRTCSA